MNSAIPGHLSCFAEIWHVYVSQWRNSYSDAKRCWLLETWRTLAFARTAPEQNVGHMCWKVDWNYKIVDLVLRLGCVFKAQLGQWPEKNGLGKQTRETEKQNHSHGGACGKLTKEALGKHSTSVPLNSICVYSTLALGL